MAKHLAQAISIELAQLDVLLATYAELLARVQVQAPDVVELAALATVLHSYYNGFEGILLAVARQIDHQVPEDARWHRALLAQVTLPTVHRPAVISKPLEMRLTVFMAFRHYFRHAYAFKLDWARLEPLVRELPEVHSLLRVELDVFMAFLATQSDET